MESSTKRNREPRRIERMLSVLAVVLGPTSAIASCSLEPMDPSLRDEKLAQLACGGRGVGGSVSIGGTFSTGGIGGSGSPTGCPPADQCTAWSCVDGGCVPTALKQPGDTCILPDQSRARCGNFYPDSGSSFGGYLVCCGNGCLNQRLDCIAFPDQGDSSCGRLGVDCQECGECASCNNTGSCVAAGNEASCPGGVCLGATCCTGCISGNQCFNNAPANCGSSGGPCTNCDDSRFCTTDTCSNGSCQHSNITGPCNDGDECTTNDTCSGSSCNGDPKNCDDGNLCTSDSCASATGCTYAPRAGTCNDGNVCTTPDSCSGGQCTGPTMNCDDGNECTTDSCNPMTGCVRTNRPDGDTCDDGNACTMGDSCQDGRCVPDTGPDCDDGNPCTMDVANCTNNTCTHPADPAHEGDPCSTGACLSGQACSNGTCSGGTPLDCNDNLPCTTDSCNDADGGCVYTPANEGDDCTDGNQCTTGNVCDNGECLGEPAECVALDDCHEVGTCDADTGTCDDRRKPNNAPCGTTGTCQGGRCTGDGVVDPTGGTGPGTAGGGPGGGDTGGTGPGDAGEGSGNAGSGGTAGTAGTAGTEDPGPLFQRDPGGCACRVPASAPARPGYLALGLASALAFVMRRRRRAA